MSRFLFLLSLILCVFAAAPQTAAQGQDSTVAERDLQVIGALLPGLYSNANQSYFDRRLGRETRHAAWEVRVSRGEAGSTQLDLAADALADDAAGRHFRLRLVLDEDRSTVLALATPMSPEAPSGADAEEPPEACELHWRRSAAEFIAEQHEDCKGGSIRRLVLSDKQLWVEIDGLEGGDLELHRAREFQCYADIPGVGGGRDEPYDRYSGLALHDQGGSAWFTSKEGRRLGVSMLLVD